MAQIFDIKVPAISKYLENIFEEGKLDMTTTVSKMEIVANRGSIGEVLEDVEFYNLDAIISVGYWVNSTKATQFRILQQITDILAECNEFNKTQKIISDFDKQLKALEKKEQK